MSYLLDTDTCIYLINGKSPLLLQRLKTHNPNDIKLSAITVSELFFGVFKSERQEQNHQALLKFLIPFEIIPFGEPEAVEFGRIRAHLEKTGNRIGPYDMQIAAIALAHQLVVVTNNTREFSRIPKLNIENWTVTH